MESKIKARSVLNANYKQIMSAFSSIYTQLEFGDTTDDNKALRLAAFYTVVFFRAVGVAPIVSNIDLYMSKNPKVLLTSDDLNLAAEILVENHIHELKVGGMINVNHSEDGGCEITLTEKGQAESKLAGKDIRLL